MSVHRVHSSSIHSSRKGEATQVSVTDEWRNKMWSSHRMEYYSTFKRKEALMQATAWVNLEDIPLNEISQSQKANTV